MSRNRLAIALPLGVFAITVVACSASATATLVPPTAIPVSPSATVEPTPTSAPTPTQITLMATSQPTPAPSVDSVFIQLTDPLDEPQFYCLDVPGQGTAVRLNSPIQAHTCKPIETAEDELFALDHPGGGQIYMEAYDLCVEASGIETGSTVMLQQCSDSPRQRFVFEDGAVKATISGQASLCLEVAPGPGIATGGPSHLRRDLTLESCDSAEPARSQWITGVFDY